MTKIVRFHQSGDAHVLQIDELNKQQPGAGEVRIRVEAFGINRSDVMFRMGQYLEQPDMPSKLGYEASGVVDAIGPGVTSVKFGDVVSTIPSFSMGQYGVYGESATIPEHAIGVLPDHLSAEQRAAIWMSYLTAYGALVDIGNIGSDDHVVITAASSSVGLAAIQVAKAQQATVIAVTRKEEKSNFLLEAGADHVIALESQDLVAQVQAMTNGEGATLIFDPVAGDLLGELAQAARMEATIIVYGTLASEPTGFPLFEALGKRLTVRGYTLFEITSDPKRLERAKYFIYRGLEEGTLSPTIDKVFALDQIVEAHEYMESNLQKGKIVVKVNS